LTIFDIVFDDSLQTLSQCGFGE